MKIKIVLEYEGGPFAGWQRQADQPTVQGELENALEVFLNSARKSRGIAPAQAPAVVGSGRTDSGVHARGQVASFLWPEEVPYQREKLFSSLNGITPPQISILNISEMEDSFDARASSHSKCYRYYFLLRKGSAALWQGRAWCVRPSLCIPEMIEAAQLLRGTHDFSSFRASDCAAEHPVRTLTLSELSRPHSSLLVYTVCGSGFLKQMVRTIAGTLLEVGEGKRESGDIKQILEAKDRAQAGITAPACGLVLEWVRYRNAEK